MSLMSDQLVNDLKDVHSGKQKDASHIFDDLIKIRDQKEPPIKSVLAAATDSLQSAGILPSVVVTLGEAANKGAVSALADKETSQIKSGHLFAAVGDMLNMLNKGISDGIAAVAKGFNEIHYPNGQTLEIGRDDHGNLNKLTWGDGTTWQKQGDGRWSIKDPHGKETSKFEGTISLDAQNVLSIQAKDHSGYQLKPDGTKVINDKDGHVTELDYKDGTARKFDYDKDGKITKVTETNRNTWIKDDKGVFNEFDQQGHRTNRSNDSTPTVDADGTYRVTNNKDRAIEINYTDGSRLNYDNNGNVTQYAYPDGTEVDYHYTKGLIDSVKDRDGTTWKRDDKGMFHQYDQGGNDTGATATGNKFIPPTTVPNLYENSQTGVFDKLVGALNGQPKRAGMDSNVGPDGTNQGGLGDCYFLAAVAGVAAQDPDAIKKMIQDNHDGTYTVTFPGEPDKPIKVQAPTQDELDRFAHYNDGTYVAVLEKAHRYLTGKTDKDDGGDPAEGLRLMTGKKYHDQDMHRTEPGFWDYAIPIYGIYDTLSGGNKTTDDEVAKMLTNAFKNHQEVTAGTAKGQGPIDEHAWTVLGYDEATHTVTLRNPWGYLGFDPKKFPSVKDLGNGKFTMSLEEFHKNYQYIAIQDN